MSNVLIEAVDNHNVVVELYRNTQANSYYIELKDPITYRILNITVYTDYNKANQHLAAYKNSLNNA